MPTKGQNTQSKYLAKKQQHQKQDQQRNIQIVAIVVMLTVAIALIAWVFISRGKSSSSAPPMTIDPEKRYTATVQMENGGQFVIELYPDKAPVTVNSFVYLARKGYYDGVTFHRVLDGFMAQTGDPTGTGSGGPGYQFDNEDNDLVFDKPGVVAMANAGRDTNGSQFFITFTPQPELTGSYTIFGQVIDGMDVVNNIKRRDPNQNPEYEGDKISTITITEE